MVTPADNNYAPPKSAVADVAPNSGVPEKATRGSRLGAAIIDGLIFGIPFVPSYIVSMPALIRNGKPGAMAVWAGLAGTGGWFLFAIVASLCTAAITTVLVYKNAQTIGKKLLGIKDARTDGSRATLGRIFLLRYLLNTVIGLIPLIGPFYGLIDVLFIFGEPKRCLHDYIADTIIIRA